MSLQKRWTISRLRRGGLTHLEAIDETRPIGGMSTITRLSSIINRLRNDGFDITSEVEDLRTNACKYVLIKEPEKRKA